MRSRRTRSTGCGSSVSPRPNDPSLIEQTIIAYAAAWKARDRDAWLSTFAADATQEDPVGDPVRRGREEIGRFWDDAMERYGFIEIVPREIRVAGREAAMVWTIKGRVAEGEVIFEGVDVFTFDADAQITSVRAYWSREALHRQLQGLSQDAAR